MGFNLTDIVALAKQGYSVSDVKELLALASSKDTDPKEQEKPTDEKEAKPEKEKEPSKETAPQKSTEEPAHDNAIDEYKKEIEDLKKTIQDLQKENVTRDNSGKPQGKTDEEILNEVTRSFM